MISVKLNFVFGHNYRSTRFESLNNQIISKWELILPMTVVLCCDNWKKELLVSLTLCFDRFRLLSTESKEIVCHQLIRRTRKWYVWSSLIQLFFAFKLIAYVFRSSSSIRRFSSGRLQCRIRPDQDNLPVFWASLKTVKKHFWFGSYLQRRFSPSEMTSKPSLHLSIHLEPNILCSDKDRAVFFNLQNHFPFWTTSPLLVR